MKKILNKNNLLFCGVILVSFALGLAVGCGLCCKCKKHKRHVKPSKHIIKFFESKKAGQPLTQEEQSVIATFKKNNGECIKATMDRSELSTLEDFKKELTKLAEGNKKVEVKLSELEAYKNANADVVIKKSRACAMKARKSMSKKDKKVMRSAVSKMKIADIINL